MKQLTIVLIIVSLSINAYTQNIKHPDENADTLKHNSIGINISPFLASMLSGTFQDIPSASVLYKHYGNRFNYRIGLSVLPKFSSMNGATYYTTDKVTKEIYLYDGEIVKITDTTVMKRFDYHNSCLLTLKTGLEKTKKTKHREGGTMKKQTNTTLNQVMKEKFSSEERAVIREKAQEKVAAIRLQQVRKSHHITQKELAASMGLSQSALSELERRPNITLGTMQRYVEALGGHLEVNAVFKDGKKELMA